MDTEPHSDAGIRSVSVNRRQASIRGFAVDVRHSVAYVSIKLYAYCPVVLCTYKYTAYPPPHEKNWTTSSLR